MPDEDKIKKLSQNFSQSTNFEDPDIWIKRIYECTEQEIDQLNSNFKKAELVYNVRHSKEVTDTQDKRREEIMSGLMAERNKNDLTFEPSGMGSGKKPLTPAEHDELKKRADELLEQQDKAMADRIAKEVVEQRDSVILKQLEEMERERGRGASDDRSQDDGRER